MEALLYFSSNSYLIASLSNSVASEGRQRCGGEARTEGPKLEGLSWGWGSWRGGGKLRTPPPRVLVHFGFSCRWILLQSCYYTWKSFTPAFVAFVARHVKYCGGEKILSPPRFQHCEGERPRCPRGSDAFWATSVPVLTSVCDITLLHSIRIAF